MGEEKDESRGFRVTDRRRFADSGEARDESAPELPPPVMVDDPRAAAPSDATTPPVTFSTFVLGLSTQALFHLGEVSDPSSGAERDFESAKHVIDILGIIRDKTRNNLEPGEDSLLESILYDLRMRYVELVRGCVKEAR